MRSATVRSGRCGDMRRDRGGDRAHRDRFHQRGRVLAGSVEQDAARPIRQIDADLLGERRRLDERLIARQARRRCGRARGTAAARRFSLARAAPKNEAAGVRAGVQGYRGFTHQRQPLGNGQHVEEFSDRAALDRRRR